MGSGHGCAELDHRQGVDLARWWRRVRRSASNYFGWLLTSWLFFQAFAFYLRRSNRPAQEQPSIKLRAVGILFYVSAGLTHIVPWMMGQAGDVVDAAGHDWRIHHIREATVAILLLTICFTALLAALRLYVDGSQKTSRTGEQS